MKKLTEADIKNAPREFKNFQRLARAQLMWGMCFAFLQLLCGVAICFAAYLFLRCPS